MQSETGAEITQTTAARGRGAARSRRLGLVMALAAASALAVVSAARADNRGTATAVVRSQLELLSHQTALNKCLEASPRKTTPCAVRSGLKLAASADRHIKLISAAIDGSEATCVRTVARQQVAYLRIWRDGARALARNERKKAKRLFVSSLEIGAAQDRLQPGCFARVLVGGG
jgi:hypothetical protein